jgi:MFS family permease
MPAPRQRDLAQLSFLYFPLTLFWTAMLSQILPERIEAMAGSEKGLYIALVGSGGAIVATLCMFLVGPLSDHTTHPAGRRYPWVMGGILVGTMGALLFPLAQSLPVLLLAFVLARLGFAAAVASYEAILPDRVPLEYQSRASGWGEFFDLLGQVGGLALTSLMVQGVLNSKMGTHFSQAQESRLAVLLICAGCALALVGVLVLNLSWIRGEPLPKSRAIPWRQALAYAFEWRPAQAPNFARLYVSRCVLNFGTYIGIVFLRYYVIEALPMIGTDPTHEVMLIGLCVTAGGVVGALAGGWMGDFYSKRMLLYVFCSLSALAAVGFCLTDSLELARAIGFFYGIGFSAINAVDWAFATNLVPEGEEARYLSIFQTSFYLPQILVMGAGGLIGQQFGYRALFWLIPISLVVGMLLLARVRERNQLSLSQA